MYNYFMSSYKNSNVKLNNERSKSPVGKCSNKLGFSNRSGFTLVEVMVAAVLILIISALFINFITFTLKARTMAKGRLIAMSMAVETIEEISSVQGEVWDDIDELVVWITGEDMEFTNKGDDDTYFKNDGKYTIFILIDEEQPEKEDGTTVDGLFEVIVTVKYDADRQVSLATVFREV